jgi:hypothetical protein
MSKQKIKVKLGNAPKNFKKVVEIVLLSGVIGEIEMSFIYRTRKQFAELVDERMAAAAEVEKAEAEKQNELEAAGAAGAVPAVAKPKTVLDWFNEADEGNAAYVLKIADGWDLDDPFTEKSLLQLENENPGALNAIATVYRTAVAEARTKN